ncbi:MAG: methyltransferase domain-containing protein [bacterium]
MQLPFVCPTCKKLIERMEAEYRCQSCHQAYPIIKGIPVFIDLKDFEDEEKQYAHQGSDTPATPVHKSDKSRQLDYYIRAHPATVLLKQGCSNKIGIDIGVGTGKNQNFEHLFSKVSHNLVGVDVSLSAAIRFKTHYPDTQYILAITLPFQDNTFDFITASGLLHHMIGQPPEILNSAVQEWFRVLKPGGIIVINDPNLYYPLSAMMFLPNKIIQALKPGARGRVAYERPLTFLEVRKLFKRIGFDHISCEASTFAHRFMPATLIRLIMKLDPVFMSRVPFNYFGAWTTIHAEKKSDYLQ